MSGCSHIGVMIGRIVCNICKEPVRHDEGVCAFFVRKFHLSHDEVGRCMEQIQLNDQIGLLNRDLVAGLVDDDTLRFRQKLFKGFLCQWQVVFFPYHKPAPFVGKDVFAVLLADPHDGIGAQISLLDLIMWIRVQIIGKLSDRKFTFDFHDFVLRFKMNLWMHMTDRASAVVTII